MAVSVLQRDGGSRSQLADTVEGLLEVQVLGGFSVTRGGAEVELPASTWRLVALMALDRRSISRSRAAETLWGDKDAERAHANLRTALWRVRQYCPDLLATTPTGMRMQAGVELDLDRVAAQARGLDGDGPCDPSGIDPAVFTVELLPDWCDAFVELHREIVHQMNLHALENLGRRLMLGGHTARALQAALTAVSQSPLRESAHQLVIEIHLREGNVGEARRQFEQLADLLWRELRVRPSPSVRAALAGEGLAR